MQGLYPSNLPKEYQGIAIFAYGTIDPRIVATSGTQGQIYLLLPTGTLLRKTDNGVTTNWVDAIPTPAEDTVRIDGNTNVQALLTDTVIVASNALPNFVDLNVGSVDNQKVTIKSQFGSTTIVPEAGSDIDGAPNLVLAGAGEAVTLIKSGTTWYAISRY